MVLLGRVVWGKLLMGWSAVLDYFFGVNWGIRKYRFICGFYMFI